MQLPRKRFVYWTLIYGSITGVLLCAFVFRHFFPSIHSWRVQVGPDIKVSPSNCNLECGERGSTTEITVGPPDARNPLDPLASLNGPPTLSYKDNLRKGTKYITSWGSSAGWTNDVIAFINLVYLGLITDRVSVLPVFLSTHLEDPPPLNFGEAFDMPRLRRELGKPVLEWREVKEPGSPILDDIGCWNTWESVQYREQAPRHSNVPWRLNLDISYTRAPIWVKMIPNFEHDQHSTFWSLASLAFPAARTANLATPLPSSQHRVSLPPDEHLLCYDFLYYVAAQEPFEIGLDYSPAWRYVGQYMRWTVALERLADEYVRKTLGLHVDDPIPPFITIHARREDFQGWCGDYTTEQCFAPLDVIARRVHEVKAELWHRKGFITNNIIITSDETDKLWWAQVAALGWRTPDHTHTEKTYGVWYSVLIDSVILSQGSGFVGTDRSTMSILAARRVESWHEGPVRLVLWGKPGADDHDD